MLIFLSVHALLLLIQIVNHRNRKSPITHSQIGLVCNVGEAVHVANVEAEIFEHIQKVITGPNHHTKIISFWGAIRTRGVEGVTNLGGYFKSHSFGSNVAKYRKKRHVIVVIKHNLPRAFPSATFHDIEQFRLKN